jgi:hypothetical protein
VGFCTYTVLGVVVRRALVNTFPARSFIATRATLAVVVVDAIISHTATDDEASLVLLLKASHQVLWLVVRWQWCRLGHF